MNLRKPLRFLSVILMLLLSSTLCSVSAQETPPGQLTVYFFDVGQGDAILVDCGEHEVLIDGGVRGSGIVGYLTRCVDGPLEVMVASHPDLDHVGGLTEVLEAFDVQQVWVNGDDSTCQPYLELVDALRAEGAEVHTARRGDTITVGELVFAVLNPVHLKGDVNDDSIVLELGYGQVDFLLEGDAEEEAEAEMLAAGLVHQVEILKVGHHGVSNASSSSFLAAAQPQVAVIQADDFNADLRAETTERLRATGASVYVTDVRGSVWVCTDGRSCSVRTAA